MRHFTLAALAALLHITPTVVLVKRENAVRQLLPDATSFTAREVHLASADAHRLHEATDWGPEDGVLTFYTGHAAAGAVGALQFVRVDSPHGPIEVAVAIGADGSVRGVVVTKATAETKSWVQEAVRAGLLASYAGLRADGHPAGAAALRPRVGVMPAYMAEQVDRGVARALAAYGMFYGK